MVRVFEMINVCRDKFPRKSSVRMVNNLFKLLLTVSRTALLNSLLLNVVEVNDTVSIY